MKTRQKLAPCLFLTLFMCLISISAHAEGEKDNTGTNPINFTNDFRIYYNFLKADKDQNNLQNGTATVEYRTPFADGKWQFRIRAPYTWRKGDVTGDGIDDIDDNGLANFNIRLLTVPILKMEKKFALATGLEVFFDTANDPKLGGSSTSLGPQVFAVFFKPPGGGALIAPAYQHVFSVGGKDVNRTQLDCFYLYTWKDKFFNWALINPQGVIDYENDNDSHWNIDAEFGKMITKNQSVYIRPGIGLGGDRFYDWDMEVGWKMIW